jgi:hypothetical protein
MLRLALLVVALAGCRFHFDSLSSDDGGPGDGGSDTSGDTTMVDAAQTPLVQSVQFDAASLGFTMTNANSGLVPVTAGNMVFVVCGHPTASGQCFPTSTPAATWQQIDGGTSLGVYVACGAPAITSITLQNGAGGLTAVVTEWKGIVAANCLDKQRISNPCPTPPGTWTSLATPAVTQNRELILAAGMASAVDAGWTIDTPFVMARDAKGAAAQSNVYTAYQLVDAAPTSYTATGTIQQSAGGLACFNDVFTFKAL